jgi:hypothetical protein
MIERDLRRGNQMRRMLSFVAFLSGALLTVPSLAAVVDSVQGEVWINRGGGFQLVAGAVVQGNVGDFVMAGENSSARIVYPDGCSVQVIPGNVIAITDQSPCIERALSDDSRGLTAGLFALGAVGVGVATYFLLKNEDDKPASP